MALHTEQWLLHTTLVIVYLGECRRECWGHHERSRRAVLLKCPAATGGKTGSWEGGRDGRRVGSKEDAGRK